MENQKNERDFTAFKDLGQGTRSVHLDWFGNDTPQGMIEGFRRAALKIVEGAQTDSSHPDPFFWPVAFLYRHALELALKEIIRAASELMDEELADGRPVGHNLDSLWKRARPLILKIWPDRDDDELKPVDILLTEFHFNDPKGDAFRYLTDMKGNIHLKNLPRVFSLEHLANTVEEALDILEGVSAGIDGHIEWKHEMESEYRDNGCY